MRPCLLFADRDLDLAAPAPASPALAADLGLDRLYAAMAGGDELLEDAARRVVPASLQSADAIRYRQAILADCVANPAVPRALYRLAGDAVEAERRVWGAGMRNPELVLGRALEVLEVFLGSLGELRRISRANRASVSSQGLLAFFERVEDEVDDAFIAAARGHVAALRDRTIHVSARLGQGNRGAGYVLHRRPQASRQWRTRMSLGSRRSHTLTVLLSDQNAMNTLAEVRAQAIAPAASALAESAGHILEFFRLLRAEVGFYVGCLGLRDRLAETGTAVCMPDPLPDGGVVLGYQGLRDPGLCLAGAGHVVGNDLAGTSARLVVVTGANGGGKSTLLRAVGLAQLMLQAGMFVAADAFGACLRSGVLTHFIHGEDQALERGKLDEELARLSDLLDAATPRSLVLLNESFASTNEREASELAGDVVAALVDSGVAVWFVTHLHQYPADLHRTSGAPARFLRPEVASDGARTFRVTEAPPEPAGHGAAMYQKVFGVSA